MGDNYDWKLNNENLVLILLSEGNQIGFSKIGETIQFEFIKPKRHEGKVQSVLVHKQEQHKKNFCIRDQKWIISDKIYWKEKF